MTSPLLTIKRTRILCRYFLELRQVGIGPSDPGELEYQQLSRYFDNIVNRPIKFNEHDPFRAVPASFGRKLHDLLGEINKICNNAEHAKAIDDLCDSIRNSM
jgi:hypothetical protein